MSGLLLLAQPRLSLVLENGCAMHACTLSDLRAAQTGNSASTAASILAACQDLLKSEIDAEAERRRLLFITPGSGQAMEYQRAEAEATQVLAALAADPKAELDAAVYPMLARGDPSTDIAGEARAVDTASKAWASVGAAIRGIRLKGKAAIDAAKTPEDAAAAFDAVVWPDFGGQ